jgi:hypothetical protein
MSNQKQDFLGYYAQQFGYRLDVEYLRILLPRYLVHKILRTIAAIYQIARRYDNEVCIIGRGTKVFSKVISNES